ncbi:MAG TPA: Trm112 family protein [Lacipirellula sp.]
MIEARLVEILRCPQDRSRLRVAPPETVNSINRAIEAGTAVNLAGERLERRIDGGLIREKGDLLYPVIDEIPVMLPDEALELARYQ